MTTRLLGRSVGRVIFYLGPPNVYKRGSQFGSETVAQYKTLPSFPGLARSSLAVRNPRILYYKRQTRKAWKRGFLVLKKNTFSYLFEAVYIAIVNQLIIWLGGGTCMSIVSGVALASSPGPWGRG